MPRLSLGSIRASALLVALLMVASAALPLSGGNPVILDSVAGTTKALAGLSARDGTLYWINVDRGVWRGSIMAVQSPSGTPRHVVDGDAPAGFVVDQTAVYWIQANRDGSGAIMKTPLAGGSSITVVGERKALASQIAVDADSLYFAETIPGGVNGVPQTQSIYRTCK